MRTEKLKTATDGNGAGKSAPANTSRTPMQPYPAPAQNMIPPGKKKCGCSLSTPDNAVHSNDSPSDYYKRYYAQQQR